MSSVFGSRIVRMGMANASGRAAVEQLLLDGGT